MADPTRVAPGRANFDVICAGEPVWRATRGGRGLAAPPVRAGLLEIATMLALVPLRVGLATVLEDDRSGRAALAEVAALGVEVGGVKLGAPVTDLVVLDAGGGHSPVLSAEGTAPDPEVPASWSSPVLLLSGLSALTSRLAASCKAARSARRGGAAVVLDVVGNLRHWAGRDPRVISMLLREADVVRCSFLDLAVIGMDSASLRRAMRPGATLVINDDGATTAMGPFGEVRVEAPRAGASAGGVAEGCAAAICAELARPSRAGETTSARWHRVLRHEAPKASASLRPRATRAVGK